MLFLLLFLIGVSLYNMFVMFFLRLVIISVILEFEINVIICRVTVIFKLMMTFGIHLVLVVSRLTF